MCRLPSHSSASSRGIEFGIVCSSLLVLHCLVLVLWVPPSEGDDCWDGALRGLCVVRTALPDAMTCASGGISPHEVDVKALVCRLPEVRSGVRSDLRPGRAPMAEIRAPNQCLAAATTTIDATAATTVLTTTTSPPQRPTPQP